MDRPPVHDGPPVCAAGGPSGHVAARGHSPLGLPDGRGTAVLARVQADGLPVRVGLLSGSDEAAVRAETRHLRPDAVFTKPPDWDAVLRWIDS